MFLWHLEPFLSLGSFYPFAVHPPITMSFAPDLRASWRYFIKMAGIGLDRSRFFIDLGVSVNLTVTGGML
jgi:hypothetical protein